MDIEVVTTAERLEELAADWTALEAALGRPPYYVRHHFVQAWWAAYSGAPGHELRTLVAHHNGQVVGIAPLALVANKRNDRTTKRLRFASHGDYMGVLIDSRSVRSDTVSRRIVRHLEEDPAWDVLSLGNVQMNTAFAHYLLKSNDYNAQFKLHVENPYVDLGKYASFDEYSHAYGVKRIRKRRNRFYHDLSPAFILFAGAEGDIFTRMGELHRREKEHLQGHGRAERHSLYDDPRRVALYQRIYNGTGETLTFAYQATDGTLLGYKSCYVDQDVLLSWNTAYHPDYASYSIGEILLYDIMQHLFAERQITRLDLGAGRYPWKFGWTDQFRSTYRLTVRRPVPEPAPVISAPRKKKPVPTEQTPTPPAVTQPAGKDTPTPASPVAGLLRRFRSKRPG